MKRQLAKKGLAYVVMTAMAMTSMPVAAFADEPAAIDSTVIGNMDYIDMVRLYNLFLCF